MPNYRKYVTNRDIFIFILSFSLYIFRNIGHNEQHSFQKEYKKVLIFWRDNALAQR